MLIREEGFIPWAELRRRAEPFNGAGLLPLYSSWQLIGRFASVTARKPH